MRIIEVDRLRKVYRGSLGQKPSVAARSISLEVEAGEIHGFLGPNGAGKSTTIKALLGLLEPDGGTLKLFGEPTSAGRWRSRVGYMPEHPNFYEYVTGRELVTWFGRLAGLSAADAKKSAEKLLERVGLASALDRRVRGYSKGMLQRAGLAQALVGDPELLVLDEPMTGLDPIGRKEIRELIVSLRDEGRTIFYSTHILPDIEMTCDRVTIVDKGETRRAGRMDDILTETTRGVTIVLEGLPSAARSAIEGEAPSIVAEGDRVTLEVEAPDRAEALVRRLLAEHPKARLLRFEPHRDDLETIFVRSLGERAQTDTTP